MEHYITKTDIIRCHLLPNSIVMKFCNQKCEYKAVQKYSYHSYIFIEYYFLIFILFSKCRNALEKSM